jgi:hypothetical protein
VDKKPILLDHNLPHPLRGALLQELSLSPKDIYTVRNLELDAHNNGNLIMAAHDRASHPEDPIQFRVFVTGDVALAKEQKKLVRTSPMGFVLLRGKSNSMETYGPMVPRIADGIRRSIPARLLMVRERRDGQPADLVWMESVSSLRDFVRDHLLEGNLP